MSKMILNDHGKIMVKDFLYKNHINGADIIQKEFKLNNWYHLAENAYNTGEIYPIITIIEAYCKHSYDVSLIILDHWVYAEINTDIDRIGINEQIRPELLKRKVRDWS